MTACEKFVWGDHRTRMMGWAISLIVIGGNYGVVLDTLVARLRLCNPHQNSTLRWNNT